MNSNLTHNILNALILLSAGVTGALMASGCLTDAAGRLDCAQSFLGPETIQWALMINAASGAMKLGMNAFRDGIGGMAKPQPPVTD